MADDLDRDIVHFEPVVVAKLLEGQARPKVRRVATASPDRRAGLQVALLADRFGQRPREARGVNDGVVNRSFEWNGSRGVVPDVQFARPVAPLTADRRFGDPQPANHVAAILIGAPSLNGKPVGNARFYGANDPRRGTGLALGY